MRKVTLSVLVSATLMAGGYKIPENSINSVARSGANVANANGADAAYFNPAAMMRQENLNYLEIDTTYIHLTPVDFAGTTGSYSSKAENFIVPAVHFVSKKLGDNGARVGMSITAPTGLSKRWEAAVPKATAQEFTLQVIEFNPTVAFALSDTVDFGFGFRVLSTSGVVKASRAGVYDQDMTGSSIDYGYNLALNSHPIPELSLAMTYRSKVDLGVEGDADLFHTGGVIPGDPLPTFSDNYSASVSVPVPAVLSLAGAYSFTTGTTLEFTYERTYWSAYKNLDFDYDNAMAKGFFGASKAKNWEDTNTYRLGLTQKYDKWIAMAGIAYDETPVPESTLGYELPDSDAWIISLGGKYKMDEQWTLGLAGLVDIKKSRDVNNDAIDGEFSNAKAYLVTAGIEYKF
jgi:long-chain fatty acid transport protein